MALIQQKRCAAYAAHLFIHLLCKVRGPLLSLNLVGLGHFSKDTCVLLGNDSLDDQQSANHQSNADCQADHGILDIENCPRKLKPGDIMEFSLSYNKMLYATNRRDIPIKFLHE